MNIKNTITQHYNKFFDLHAKGIALDEDDHLNIDWAEDLVKNCFIPNVRLSLCDAKQTVAEMYSKKDWDDVLIDYEYGLDISKMLGFEDLMDKVAEVYKGNEA
jgi:hypothetical protein